MDSTTRRQTAGFTLIELLIALAIIAITAAILFPVFAGVRERGRRTACQSNLKQMALAMQQYVQDNDGIYPSSPGYWANAPYAYLKNTNVFHCPDYAADGNASRVASDPADPSDTWVEYSYDYGWLIRLAPPFPGTVLGVQESRLLTPSTIILNEDSAWITPDGEWHDGRPSPKSSCGREGGGSTIHSGAGNYSYVDSHIKWLTPEEAGEMDCANGPRPAPFQD